MTSSPPPPVRAWHDFVAAPRREDLTAMLAPDVEFRSPAVHTPQAGRDLTFAYLWAAVGVLGPTLAYGRQWHAADSAVLEFTATVDDRDLHGVDMMAWNADGLITSFTVMVRPWRGLEALATAMSAELQRVTGA